MARAKSALKVETSTRSSTAGPIVGSKPSNASSSRTKSSSRHSTIPEDFAINEVSEGNQDEFQEENEDEIDHGEAKEKDRKHRSNSQIVPTALSKKSEGKASAISKLSINKSSTSLASASDRKTSSNTDSKKSSTQKSSANIATTNTSSSTAPARSKLSKSILDSHDVSVKSNTKGSSSTKTHQASTDLTSSSPSSKQSMSSVASFQQQRPRSSATSMHSPAVTSPDALASFSNKKKKSNIASNEPDEVDTALKGQGRSVDDKTQSKTSNLSKTSKSSAATKLDRSNSHNRASSKPSHTGTVEKDRKDNINVPKHPNAESSVITQAKPSTVVSSTEETIDGPYSRSKKSTTPPQNLLHLRVVGQHDMDKFSSSMDNLSTHVNASSGGSSQHSDPEVSSGSESPVPDQHLSSSPEPTSSNESSSHKTGRNDTRAITPIVSSASDSEETDSFPTMLDHLPGVGKVGFGAQSSSGSALSAVSKINKRSESDGIVVAERPRPDKQPVRRCESTDDAGLFGSERTSSLNDTSDSITSMHTDTDRIQFPKNIKTVSSATIVKGPEDNTLGIGETVQFRAHYFGNPEPRVTWIKNGVRITVKDLRVNIKTYSGESTLIVKDLRADDSGKYEVLIENEIGNDAASASLSVEGPPEPPNGRPYVSNIDTSTLTLAWYGSTYDGGSMVTGYVVEMSSWPITSDSRPPEATDWTVVDSHHTTSYIVKNLDPGREYIFRVKAENSHGQSEPSRVSEPVCFGTSGNSGNEDELGLMDGAGGANREGSVAGEDSSHEEYVDHDPTFEAPFTHRMVTIEKGEVFKSKYEVFEELGRGRFGVVFKVKDKSSGEQFAAKFIRCRKSEEKIKVRDEIEIMNNLAHSKLLQLASGYENPREMIMVMEYIGGGELFEKVVAEDFTLTERDCLLFMRQICQAIG